MRAFSLLHSTKEEYSSCMSKYRSSMEDVLSGGKLTGALHVCLQASCLQNIQNLTPLDFHVCGDYRAMLLQITGVVCGFERMGV